MRRIGTIGAVVVLVGCGAVGLAQERAGVEADPVVLCPVEEPGRRITFSGRVYDMDGRPLSEAAIVAYGADTSGHYAPPESGSRVPRLRGVAITDEQGGYAFETVYPGGYPGRDDPSHIHLTVAAPMHGIEYVTFWFEGDPRLTRSKRRAIDQETVIVELRDGAFRHDIHLSGS